MTIEVAHSLPPDLQSAIAAVRAAWTNSSAAYTSGLELEESIRKAKAIIAEIEQDDSKTLEAAAKTIAAQRDIVATAEARLPRLREAHTAAQSDGMAALHRHGVAVKNAWQALFEYRVWMRIESLVSEFHEWVNPAAFSPGNDGEIRHTIYTLAHFDSSLEPLREVSAFTPSGGFMGNCTEAAFEAMAKLLEDNGPDVAKALEFETERNAKIHDLSARGQSQPLTPADWIDLRAA